MNFEQELTQLLNRYSQENGSNTPDFILAQFLLSCLTVFNATVQRRENWYGRGSASTQDPRLISLPPNISEDQIKALLSLLK